MRVIEEQTVGGVTIKLVDLGGDRYRVDEPGVVRPREQSEFAARYDYKNAVAAREGNGPPTLHHHLVGWHQGGGENEEEQRPTAPILAKLLNPAVLGEMTSGRGDNFTRRLGKELAARVVPRDVITPLDFLLLWEHFISDAKNDRAGQALAGFPWTVWFGIELAGAVGLAEAVCDADFARAVAEHRDRRDHMAAAGELLPYPAEPRPLTLPRAPKP